MLGSYEEFIRGQLKDTRAAGLWKPERVLASPQQPQARLQNGDDVLILCANNYLGLADDPRVLAAAREALDRWGYGMASVRFICGTQEPHKELEQELARFLGTEDAILYSSCFDANGGLFETLLSAEDAVLSDELNHASIIDGIRLSKAQRYRYKNRDMAGSGGAASIGAWRALPHDRDRRRFLHGWHHGASVRNLRARGEIRRDGDGG
jgi:glycine C-acetyltransferase